MRVSFKERNYRNILQPETLKGMDQDTHTQINRGQERNRQQTKHNEN